jgi:hypothetical protein
MKKFSSAMIKVLLIFAAVGSLTMGVLWGKPEKAYYIFEGGELKSFLPINNWNEATLKLIIDAKGWQKETVEAQIKANVIHKDNELSYYIYNGNSWIEADPSDDNYPLELVNFQSTTLSIPSIATFPNFENIKNVNVSACLRIKNQGGEAKDCVNKGYTLNSRKKNPSTNQGTLTSSSIKLNSELNMAIVNYYPAQITQKIYFDMSLSSQMMAEGFYLYPEVTGKPLDFSQVKITVYPKDADGKVIPVALITIQNGVIKQDLPFSMGQENLPFPDSLKVNLDLLKDQMNLKGQKEELLKMLDNNFVDNAKNVDPSLLKDVQNELKDWNENLMGVINAGFGDQKTQRNSWLTGIWKPMFNGFRVEVEVKAGAPAFKLFSLLSPFVILSPAQQLGLSWDESFNKTDELKWATKELTINSPANFNLRNKSFPSTIDDLSPDCRAKVESGWTKLYTSLVFNGLAGGVVSKAVGFIGAGYASAAALESAGTLAGWSSGAIFDALSPIDQAKFYISFFAANAFSYDISKIESQIVGGKLAPGYPDLNTYCIGYPFKIRALWFNECGMIMAGHNSEQFTRLIIDPKNIADIDLEGPVNGVSGLVGSGALYKVTPILVGTAKFKLYVHDLNHIDDHIEVKFVNCSSPLSNVIR